jgi:uncharacterized YccA/Bax inhibitor family protein
VQSSNPVLTRLRPEPVQAPPTGYGYPGQPSTGYTDVISPAATDRMTIDDVVVRTVGLLLLTGLSGAAAWYAFSEGLVAPGLVKPVFYGSMIIGLILGLVISIGRIINPFLIGAYAVVEGVFVGLISMAFESVWSGIVLQAAIGTFGIFLVMTALYKFRVIRATPRFTRGLIAAVTGILVIYVINFVLYAFFDIASPLRGGAEGKGTWLSIGFSLVVIVIASLTFILDFDLIEDGVRSGAPRKMAWYCAFGLLVGLIWVYLEVLRLLSYLRGRD